MCSPEAGRRGVECLKYMGGPGWGVCREKGGKICQGQGLRPCSRGKEEEKKR